MLSELMTNVVGNLDKVFGEFIESKLGGIRESISKLEMNLTAREKLPPIDVMTVNNTLVEKIKVLEAKIEELESRLEDTVTSEDLESTVSDSLDNLISDAVSNELENHDVITSDTVGDHIDTDSIKEDVLSELTESDEFIGAVMSAIGAKFAKS